MTDSSAAHPHQPIWLWAAGAWLVVAGVIVAGYLARARQFDETSPLMLVAYACGALTLVCVNGALRGWRFPFTKQVPVEKPKERTESAEIQQPYNMDRFNEMQDRTKPAEVPDAGDGLPESKEALDDEETSDVERTRSVEAEAVPVHGPDIGTAKIPYEDEVMLEVVEQWPSTVEDTEDGVILSITRPQGEDGRLSRCTVTQIEYGRENRWSHVITGKNGFNLFGENGYDLDEWYVEFPNDFRGGAALIPLAPGRYHYRWIANCGSLFFGNPSWRTVASGEFGR